MGSASPILQKTTVNTKSSLHCPQCSAESRTPDPFCPECGALSPHMVREGPFAVEIQEIASEKLRTGFVELLVSWFPQIDRFLIDRRLSAGPSTLMAGIDEQSADRLLAVLRTISIGGKLRPALHGSNIGQFWNAGLGISALLLVLSYISGGAVGALLLIAALAAPVLWGAVRRTREAPLVPTSSLVQDADTWNHLSARYSSVIKELAPEDAMSLRSITKKLFDLQESVRSGSLVSMAAGGDAGSLYGKLVEMISAAVDLSARISSSQGKENEKTRRELKALVDLVDKTSAWYSGLDSGQIKPPAELTRELQDAAGGIERIMQDVRSVQEPERTTGKKLKL